MMMRDAMNGKIDMIITKAVSRFARNLVECINWVRELKKHDPPIAVYFEQENVNTLASTSNLILFVLAMVAEEESHMKSEAMLLSLEWRFSRGRFLIPPLLGYDKVEIVDKDGMKKKTLVINEDQAPVVRYMYYSLLNGASTTEIAENLNAMKILTGGRKKDGSPNDHWTPSGIATLLRNERYCGDVLARKSFTPDFHDHKSKKNRGKKNKYYQAGHHEGIVTRAQWNAAQRILNSSRYNHGGSYKNMQVIEQGALCGYISVNKSWAGFDLSEYFRVSSIVMGLENGDPEVNLEEELLPEAGHKLAGTYEENGVQRIARQLSEAEQAIKDELEGIEKPEINENLVPQFKSKSVMETRFQVVSGNMFTHSFEPTLTIRRGTLSLGKACWDHLIRHSNTAIFSTNETENAIYLELLFNPIERMLAIRPCDPSHPNAIKWDKKKPGIFSASIFCRLLYELQGWDENYKCKIPASIRVKNGGIVLFFDLDKTVESGVKITEAVENLRQRLNASATTIEEKPLESPDCNEKREFFFAGDEEEPQDAGEIQAMQQRLSELTEINRVTFGTLLCEHADNEKPSTVNDADSWESEAKPKTIGSDHKVADHIVSELEELLLLKNTRS